MVDYTAPGALVFSQNEPSREQMATSSRSNDDDIVVTGIEEAEETPPPRTNTAIEPDEFFSKNAFRVVYQTNNFLLPQLRDLVVKVIFLIYVQSISAYCVGLHLKNLV